jgi:hypothetical protein
VYGIEHQAIVDQFRAAAPELRGKLILGWSELDGALVTRLERVDNGWYNRALIEQPISRGVLEAIVRQFRAQGSKNFSLELLPEAASLKSDLLEMGFQPTTRWAKITREVSPVEVSPVDDVARLVDPREALTFGKVSCAGWGQPPPLAPWIASLVGRDHWRAYLAWDRGEPIGAALLYINDGIGWLGGDATLAAHRQRGGQSALIARRIHDAHALGVRTLFAEVVEDGGSRRNAEKMGFQVAYVRESFTRSASK